MAAVHPVDPRSAHSAAVDDLRPGVASSAPMASTFGTALAPGLPVVVTGPRHVVTQVAAFVEASLGWQVTDGDHLPPRVHLAAVQVSATSAARVTGADVEGGLPTIVLVGPDDPPVAVAQLARRADAVLAWPDDHDRVERVVARVVGGAAGAARPDRAPLTVAGSAGGVGTTTVALSIAGWIAWEGGRALAVVAGDGPVSDIGRVTPSVLAGHRGWPAATSVPDVAGLRVVAAAGPVTDVVVPADVRVVVDRGVVAPAATAGVAAVTESEPDVLVVRRDRAGCRAVGDHPTTVVVVVDAGPRALREVAAAATGRPLVVVPWSVRAERAHDRAAVPGALPRTVLDPLRGLADVPADTLR